MYHDLHLCETLKNTTNKVYVTKESSKYIIETYSEKQKRQAHGHH